ncbi:hypothetical protein GUITHDRAFT_119427 [Guillardia theta CCMP2712]|uniref:Uncharacterized protein n=1 Tax=Guillardia theta (strain CCMP2712) TaxID=905079 RepID=L1IDT4_GUITC|nr:hypothetical protein GUITHDRAFT_119427 [Guillardia theta CCMP2712]EKX34421.1 hypothetical protein GUITHDRAFT_119427 [Guillardia theta CCMP2712]|eukprot:XP_005821401.1 hypothetical protein GUITHDRAFT_119427 [Guillardia theta CCMP2712]
MVTDACAAFDQSVLLELGKAFDGPVSDGGSDVDFGQASSSFLSPLGRAGMVSHLKQELVYQLITSPRPASNYGALLPCVQTWTFSTPPLFSRLDGTLRQADEPPVPPGAPPSDDSREERPFFPSLQVRLVFFMLYVVLILVSPLVMHAVACVVGVAVFAASFVS